MPGRVEMCRCKPGDRLRLCNGTVATYKRGVSKDGPIYGHVVSALVDLYVRDDGSVHSFGMHGDYDVMGRALEGAADGKG